MAEINNVKLPFKAEKEQDFRAHDNRQLKNPLEEMFRNKIYSLESLTFTVPETQSDLVGNQESR